MRVGIVDFVAFAALFRLAFLTRGSEVLSKSTNGFLHVEEHLVERRLDANVFLLAGTELIAEFLQLGSVVPTLFGKLLLKVGDHAIEVKQLRFGSCRH